MFHLAETAKSAALSPWPFGIVAVIALIVGLALVIRPRQSGEAWRKAQQSVMPYWRLQKIPIGASIAVGSLCLLVAVAMAYAVWAVIQS